MSNQRISVPQRASVFSLIGVLLFSSCSYTSDYVAPSDGRARLVWHDGEPTAAVPTGTQACAAQAVRLSGRELDLGPCNNGRCAEPRFFWPVYYVSPPLLVPGHLHGPPPVPKSGPHRASPVGSKVSGGSTDGRAFVVIAALALVGMPIVAIALAASRPERPEEVAGAIDYVNTMNDVVRDPNNGCMNTSPPPPPPAPVPEEQP